MHENASRHFVGKNPAARKDCLILENFH